MLLGVGVRLLRGVRRLCRLHDRLALDVRIRFVSQSGLAKDDYSATWLAPLRCVQDLTGQFLLMTILGNCAHLSASR